jgi:L-threonylcarbamoyladenylate synthase
MRLIHIYKNKESVSVGQIIRVDADRPSFQSLTPAVEILRAGGVVAYPTETFYGLGVDALSPEAIKKIFAIKERSFLQPLLILIPDQSYLPRCVAKIPEKARYLMEHFWPGPLTMVFSASPQLLSILTAGTQKIAIRISSHPIARALTSAFAGPLTSTSANISGDQSPATAKEVSSHLGGMIDLIIDGGKTPGQMPSTIVDVTFSPPQLIREGVIPFSEILTFLESLY